MRHRRDALHLDGVALLERAVQDPGRVQHLPAQVLVVRVPHVDALGGERVRLHLHVRARDFVHERRLADVGVAAHQDGARVGVYARQTGHVLPDLLQVRQRRRVFLHDRAHAPERRAFQLFAAVQRVAVLQQLDVVLRDLVDDVARGVELPERQLVVVLVVQHVEQVGVERVDVVHAREVVQDAAQLLVPARLRELHLAHVELADARDGVPAMHHRRRLALRPGKHHIDEILRRRDLR